MPFRLAIAAFLVLLVSGSRVGADHSSEEIESNWHQWRGPSADGSSVNAKPPLRWSESENVKWKVSVPGKGSSTPIVWKDRVYVMTAVKTDRLKEGAESAPQQAPSNGRRRRFGGGPPPTHYHEFLVIAFDRATGNEMWRTKVTEEVPHEAGHSTNNFASASPTTDGERIYAYFGSRGLYCLNMDGEVLWDRDFGAMKTIVGFGEGSSPSVHQGILVVPWDHEGESYLVALDATNGEEKWKVARDEGTTWATPLITEYNGRTQVIASGKKRVRSYDLESGDLIWECGGQASNPIPSPVRYQDNVICMTGFRGYAIYSIPLDSTGDITDSEKVTWYSEDSAPYVPSPVLYQGQLYFTKSNNGVLVSRNAGDGEIVFDETRIPDVRMVYASPVAAEGRIYLTARDGTTVVFKHGDQFEVLASNKLDDPIDASPALAGEEMFLRSESHLYCIAASGG